MKETIFNYDTPMTDAEVEAIVKRIQQETKELAGTTCFGILDGFSASVFYDRTEKQYFYQEYWPATFPKRVTKEQAQILKRELKKYDNAQGF